MNILKKQFIMKSLKTLSVLLVAALLMNASFAQDKTVEVGGAPMYPSKNIHVIDYVVMLK